MGGRQLAEPGASDGAAELRFPPPPLPGVLSFAFCWLLQGHLAGTHGGAGLGTTGRAGAGERGRSGSRCSQ